MDVTDNLKYQALVRNHLGQLYMNLDLYQDALIMNSQSVSLFQQLTDTANLVYAERDMGRIYLLKGQQDSASFITNRLSTMLSIILNRMCTRISFLSGDRL